jgi:predicted O-methyltransferase YrrM
VTALQGAPSQGDGRAPEQGGGPTWAEVDHYIAGRLIDEDPALDAALSANKAAGLPPIDVSPALGKLLHLLAKMVGARRILEIGTLGGYSTIWLARALVPGGRVTTLEIDPHHARVAASNLAQAGVADRVDIMIGPALETLQRLVAEAVEPFDFVFMDADKQSNADYLRLAVKLARPGTAIVCDNVVREGRVVDADSRDAAVQGTRRLFDAAAAIPGLTATAIQTVGVKKWDGFVLALVEDA